MACCGRSAINSRSRAAARTAPRPVAKSYPHQLLYSATETSVIALNGERMPLGGMLIRSPGRPQGGWRAAIPIKGQNVVVQGKSPKETYAAAEKLLKQNGLDVAPSGILVTLWAQWLRRTPEKYHAVSLKDLMAITTATPAGEVTVDPRKRDYTPADWGSVAWRWLNLYLAQDTFNFLDFFHQCGTVLDIMDPSKNPELGCPDCWKEWAQHLDKLRGQPGMDRTAARLWLYNVHNKVNARLSKRVLSWEEATKAAFWI